MKEGTHNHESFPPVLKQLDFASDDGELISGLIPVSEGDDSAHRLAERLAIRDAISIGGIDYVFFRRFADSRSSQAVAYVVDNSDDRFSESQLADLHKRIWLHGVVPLVYVAWPTRVDILSCARGPDFWINGNSEYNPTDKIEESVAVSKAISEALADRYSAWKLVDGTFWDDPSNAKLADSGQRAHESLIQAVVDADQALAGAENPLLRRLLLLTVLIKYLEDRRVFPANWFAGFCKGAKSFLDALREGEPDEILRLLQNLERRFNGDIFILPDGTADQMTKDVLNRFAVLVEARTIRQQRYLWDQFSFEHIPVEIVSHLYQRFVTGGHGTVYTPPFLASLLLDHAMPYERLSGEERVLDPACGSGVFLVGAFRRLVSVHRAKNGWSTVDVAELKQILKKSIFGAELDSGAIDLASFSLALAVCDALSPDVIWKHLKFDRLRGENLLEGDFFEQLDDKRNEPVFSPRFDVILGNPPFESELTAPGRAVDARMRKERGTLPDRQAAYLFLEQGIKQLTNGGRLCLIQPSGVLYNRNAAAFRCGLIKAATVEKILDFTSIRNLYQAADPKTVAFLILNVKPHEEHVISHLTFRRTFGTRERIAFEVDHYDWHRVTQHDAENDPFAWRINLLGGGRLLAMSKRLRGSESLREFIDRVQLDCGEGFIAGEDCPEQSWLTGMKFLPSKALKDDGIDGSAIEKLTETNFRRSREQTRYQAPMILIRKNERLQMDYWDKGPLAFTSTLVSINCGKSDLETLKEVYKRLSGHHRTYRLACMMHGSKAFVAKATAILKQDIDSLPYPENEKELQLSFWESVIERDTLDYFADFIRLGQNSALLTKAASAQDMRDYADVFCKMLKPVYSNINAHTTITFNGLICQSFYFGERPEDDWLMKSDLDTIESLVYHSHHESLRTVRIVRFYTGNAILLVKPDRKRFWIGSAAVRDADETILSLREQGY